MRLTDSKLAILDSGQFSKLIFVNYLLLRQNKNLNQLYQLIHFRKKKKLKHISDVSNHTEYGNIYMNSNCNLWKAFELIAFFKLNTHTYTTTAREMDELCIINQMNQ